MNNQKYLVQRGGNYYFRRRIPGFYTTTKALFFSLGTKSETFAHTCSMKLAAEIEDMLDEFVYVLDEIPEELIAGYMSVRLRHAMSDVRRQHRMERMTGRIGQTVPDQLEALRLALEILLRYGIQRVFPLHQVNASWSEQKLERVMNAYRGEAGIASSQALRTQLSKEFLDATGTSPRSLEHHAQILEVHLHSKAASLGSMDDRLEMRSSAFQDLSAQLLEDHQNVALMPSIKPATQSDQLRLHSIPQASPTNGPSRNLQSAKLVVLTPGVELIEGPLTTKALNDQFAAAAACDEELHRSKQGEPFGVDIAGACERSIKIAIAAGKIDAKTADSRRAKIKLFCLLADVQTVVEVEQFHLRVFDEKLDKIPLNFNRSHKDADLTLKEINIRAESMPDSKLGRSPSTYNSHLEMIGAVMRHAKTLDHNDVDPTIDTKSQRRTETKRARKKRAAFKPAEVKQLFAHTVWHGAKSADRRHEPGDLIVKDGLFFVPLIVAYTGGRMEEIAGLQVDSIIPCQGHFGIDIRAHDERRLKNLQSERSVPVHEHLIELGLLEHQARMQKEGQKYLFPELLPTSSKKKFLSAPRHNWRKIREIQLDGNPRNLDGHSLRHAFNQFFKVNKHVQREVRLDIMGHAGIDINEEAYGDEEGMPFELKKAAIDLQPRVF